MSENFLSENSKSENFLSETEIRKIDSCSSASDLRYATNSSGKEMSKEPMMNVTALGRPML
jgi:hypothetical protein